MSIRLLPETPINLLLELKMSFFKINLCESTQVAFNVFHMFVNNQMNMVHLERFNDDEPKQYKSPGHEQNHEVTPDELWCLSDELQGGACYEVRVHDIVQFDDCEKEVSNRRVDFLLQKGSDKIVFTVTVSRSYFAGDEARGWTRWQVAHVRIEEIRSGTSHQQVTEYYTNPNCIDPNRLSTMMAQNLGGIICNWVGATVED